VHDPQSDTLFARFTTPHRSPDRGITVSESDDGFAWHVHDYLSESIRLADAKAGGIFTLSSALLGGLSAAHKGPWNFGQGTGTTAALFWGGSVALVLAIGSSAWCVWPRLGSSGKQGAIYWRHIQAHGTGKAYADDVGKLASTPEARTRQIVEHSYDLARICANKYRWLRLGMGIMLIGGVLGLLGLLLRP
jgi:hypothetical protein